MFSKTTVRGLLAAALLASAVSAQADVFNMGGTRNPTTGTWTGLASLQFVTVGDPGNVADTQVMNDGTTGYGSVPYVYQMGKYDVTAAQYTAFLDAVAATDTYGLYNLGMASSWGACGISRSGSPGSYTYSTNKNGNFPVNDVTWGDAARFCNWLQNGQPTGAEGNGTTETGAYTLDGDTTVLMESRNAGATYFLPSEDEWYKAAYYVGGGTNAGYWAYPTKSNTVPGNTLPDTGNNANFFISHYTDPTNHVTPVGDFANSPGPYGTYDMGGDVYQWNEANVSGSFRGLRGGSFDDYSTTLPSSSRNYDSPTDKNDVTVGFRVASGVAVPEPTSIALLFAGAAAFGIWKLRRNA